MINIFFKTVFILSLFVGLTVNSMQAQVISLKYYKGTSTIPVGSSDANTIGSNSTNKGDFATDYTFKIQNLNAAAFGLYDSVFDKFKSIKWEATSANSAHRVSVAGGSLPSSEAKTITANNGVFSNTDGIISWVDNGWHQGDVTVKATVTYSRTNGTDGVVTQFVKLYLRQIPSPVIMVGATYIDKCNTLPTTYSIGNFGDADTFNWTIPTGWTKTGSGSSITVTPSNTTGGNVSCKVRISTAPISEERSLFINVYRSNPTITLNTSKDYICQGGTITANISGSTNNLTSVGWTFPSGLSISGNPAQPQTNITIAANSSPASDFVRVTASYSNNVCTASTQKFVTGYTLAPPPTIPTNALGREIVTYPVESEMCHSLVEFTPYYPAFSNGTSTISKNQFLFKRRNEWTDVTMILKNLCTNVVSSRTWNVQAPACFNDLVREIQSDSESPEDMNKTFGIYPNPTTGLITVKGLGDIKTIIVFDMMGKELVQTTTNGNTQVDIDLTQYPAGMYFLKTDKGQAQKIIKE